MEVEGTPVFVKSIALTALEQRAENFRSTANLFELPPRFHYGISSSGFGAWRELESHLMTTGWVLSGACPAFPLLFHWRVLPRVGPAGDSQTVERRAAAWGNSKPIRARLEAIREASACVVLFMERFPHNLRSWLAEGNDPSWIERELLTVTAFLRSRGFLHFDVHFENVLVDDRALYLSDFGQALSDRFSLSAAESGFLAQHGDFDRSYVVAKLGSVRYGGVAAVMNDFFERLRGDRLTAHFPSDALARAWAEAQG